MTTAHTQVKLFLTRSNYILLSIVSFLAIVLKAQTITQLQFPLPGIAVVTFFQIWTQSLAMLT